MDARNDASNPVGTPVAGDNGTSLFLTDLSPNGAAWTDTDLEALANAGVTVVRNFGGVIQTYDNVTPSTRSSTRSGSTRAPAASRWRSPRRAAIGDRHMWRLIDGQGFELTDFRNDLIVMLTRMWNRELYGATAADAFSVNVDPPVNTTETIAARKLRAQIGFKPSRGARTGRDRDRQHPADGGLLDHEPAELLPLHRHRRRARHRPASATGGAFDSDETKFRSSGTEQQRPRAACRPPATSPSSSSTTRASTTSTGCAAARLGRGGRHAPEARAHSDGSGWHSVGDPLVYTGKLKAVTPIDYDANGTTVDTFSLECSADA
jgi:hypothetical protein